MCLSIKTPVNDIQEIIGWKVFRINFISSIEILQGIYYPYTYCDGINETKCDVKNNTGFYVFKERDDALKYKYDSGFFASFVLKRVKLSDIRYRGLQDNGMHEMMEVFVGGKLQILNEE